jgi:hypothetical protein
MKKGRYVQRNAEKYRAEAFKFTGFAFCTPFGMIVFNLLTSTHPALITTNIWFAIQLVGSILLLLAGIAILTWGLDVMIKLDARSRL